MIGKFCHQQTTRDILCNARYSPSGNTHVITASRSLAEVKNQISPKTLFYWHATAIICAGNYTVLLLIIFFLPWGQNVAVVNTHCKYSSDYSSKLQRQTHRINCIRSHSHK